VPGMVPSKAGTVIRPHVHGATNWAPPSFSPRTGLYYVAHFENSSTVAVEGEFPRANGINPRQTTMGQINLQNFLNNEDEAYGVVRAYDPSTLEPSLQGTVLPTTDAILATRDPLLGLTRIADERTAETTAFLKALTDPAARDLRRLRPPQVPSGLPVD